MEILERSFRSALRRYYSVELPHDFSPQRRWPLLLALHGYQGNKDSMMKVAQTVSAGRMVVISLQGPYQFFRRFGKNPENFRVGFGWATTYRTEDSVALHHHDLSRTIQQAVGKYAVDPRQVFLLAFSQACALNYRYVFTHPEAIRGVIGVCGGIPGDWNTNPAYHPANTRVLHIAAQRDEWYTREKNMEIRRQLRQRAANLDFRFYDSSHRFPRRSIPQIGRWIGKHLLAS